MMRRHVRRSVAIGAVSLLALHLTSSVLGQGIVYDPSPVRMTMVGKTFTLIGGGPRVHVEDVENGRSRRFLGKDALVTLRAPLRLAPERTSYRRIEGLAVRFVTYKGAWLRRVELIDGGRSIFRKQTQLGGSYWKQAVTTPANAANAWVIPSITVSDQAVVELQVQFPAGFEEGAEDGEFILRDIEAAFPRRAAGDVVIPR